MNSRIVLLSLTITCLLIYSACTAAPATITQRPTAPPQKATAEVEVTLVDRAQPLGTELVNFGLPLPPAYLNDAAQVRVVDSAGNEIPAAIKALEPWRIDGRDGAIRSVQIQFTTDFSKQDTQKVKVQLNVARTKDVAKFVRVRDTLLSFGGHKGPRVLALLPPKWLCDSWIVGPQIPTSDSGKYADYDQFVDKQFARSLFYIDSESFDDWLFDRTTCWYKMYVRTGERKFLEAAYEAANFMRAHTRLDGPDAGSFTVKGEVDLKYVYPRAMHIHYLFTGDERALQAGKIMASFSLTHWDPVYAPKQLQPKEGERPISTFWTERHTGFGLLAVTHGWELTGDKVYWDKMKFYADALYKHQQQPPDGRPADGSFRRVWGSTAKAYRGASSAWMTSILIDPLFNYWMLTGDERLPGMIVDWCDFLDKYGIRPEGDKAFYVIDSPYCDPGATPSDPGPDMELHNTEMCYMFSLGAYMTTDPAKAAQYRARYQQLWPAAKACDMNSTPRAYNWAFQASPQMVFFWQQVDIRITPAKMDK